MKIILNILVALSLSSIASAEKTYSMDQITSSLQNEYRTQLKRASTRNKVSKPRKSSRKAVPANWAALLEDKKTVTQINARKTTKRIPTIRPNQQQVQRARRQEQAQARKPVPVKPAIPHRDDLFGAASSGNVQLIMRLIQQGVNVNVANSERETALHMAAAKGHYSAAIYLINHGANIHARTINNWLPIHHATRFRHIKIANYLIQRGSSPHARTSDGLSAIDMARAVRDQRLLGLFGAR